MLIHQGTLRYFSKKNPERPFRSCGFFLRNSLLHQHLISKDCLEKKEKKWGCCAVMAIAIITGAALMKPSPRRRIAITASLPTTPPPNATTRLTSSCLQIHLPAVTAIEACDNDTETTRCHLPTVQNRNKVAYSTAYFYSDYPSQKTVFTGVSPLPATNVVIFPRKSNQKKHKHKRLPPLVFFILKGRLATFSHFFLKTRQRNTSLLAKHYFPLT